MASCFLPAAIELVHEAAFPKFVDEAQLYYIFSFNLRGARVGQGLHVELDEAALQRNFFFWFKIT